ncbi:MAG: hypothetical protein Unbinned2514contig1000_9 [Prokaryotic dsDNA virus sp.]|nr:MAG: hypothetical protein Unbinned2514contig1000_9 [Prokaryotic dsDNA virus sp.]|tara:strand:+ start:5235 stop:5489 length:255 start_codon:yes stop_codon:yes gene_type:complete
MLRYFVVEPLSDDPNEEAGYQIWRVALMPLKAGQEPDEEGVVVDLKGQRWTWRWNRVGEEMNVSKKVAKREAFKLWYPSQDPKL